MRRWESARVLVIDARDRVLLFPCAVAGPAGRVWLAPGGVRGPDESWEQAARRELWEETGLKGADLGPCVWTREHRFEQSGERHHASERFFLLRVDSWEVAPAALEPHEAGFLDGFRWWSVAELRASDETFAPRRIAGLLVPLLEGDVPPEPIDAGG